MKVAEGNPGALRVISELEWFSQWEAMMEYCHKRGIVGPELWIMYKDQFGCDSHALGEHLLQMMARAKNI